MLIFWRIKTQQLNFVQHVDEIISINTVDFQNKKKIANRIKKVNIVTSGKINCDLTPVVALGIASGKKRLQ